MDNEITDLLELIRHSSFEVLHRKFNKETRELSKMSSLLSEDIKRAEQMYKKKPNDQYLRRTLVRTIVAGFEGFVTATKRLTLHYGLIVKAPLTLEEFQVCLDVKTTVKGNGKPKSDLNTVPLVPHLLFTAALVHRVFDTTEDFNPVKDVRDALLRAVAIRNRITHPKKSQDLLISDSEMVEIISVHRYFYELQHAILKEILESMNKMVSVLNAFVTSRS